MNVKYWLLARLPRPIVVVLYMLEGILFKILFALQLGLLSFILTLFIFDTTNDGMSYTGYSMLFLFIFTWAIIGAVLTLGSAFFYLVGRDFIKSIYKTYRLTDLELPLRKDKS